MLTFFLYTKITHEPSISHPGVTDHKNSQNSQLARYVATTDLATTELATTFL